MSFLRELKARKAKFGFDAGQIHLGNVIQVGRFVESLQTSFPPEKYLAEEAGYNQPSLKIYTDDEKVAEWIRNYK